MDYKKCLLEYKNKTIDLNDLSVLLKKSMADTSTLYETVIGLVESGLLAPVKKSGLNGNKKYPLYKKYRITAEPDISSSASYRFNGYADHDAVAGYVDVEADLRLQKQLVRRLIVGYGGHDGLLRRAQPLHAQEFGPGRSAAEPGHRDPKPHLLVELFHLLAPAAVEDRHHIVQLHIKSPTVR